MSNVPVDLLQSLHMGLAVSVRLQAPLDDPLLRHHDVDQGHDEGEVSLSCRGRQTGRTTEVSLIGRQHDTHLHETVLVLEDVVLYEGQDLLVLLPVRGQQAAGALQHRGQLPLNSLLLLLNRNFPLRDHCWQEVAQLSPIVTTALLR